MYNLGRVSYKLLSGAYLCKEAFLLFSVAPKTTFPHNMKQNTNYCKYCFDIHK